MSIGTESVVKQIVLSPSAFGPNEIVQIVSAIGKSYSNYRELREAAAELEEQPNRSPATSARLGVCLYLLGPLQRRDRNARSQRRRRLTHFYLGKAYLALDKYAEALTAYESAEKAGYSRDHVALAKAEALRYNGRPQEAVDVLNKLSGAVEQTAEYLYQRAATVSALGGNPTEVVALFERAVAADGNHAGALFGLALENDRHGNDSYARDLYERAAAQFPTHVGTLLNLGVLYEDMQQYEKARQCYRRILDVFPDHPRARLFLKDADAARDMFYDEDARRRQDRLSQVLGIPVTDFELSVRSRNCLQKMGIMTLGDLTRMQRARTARQQELRRNFARRNSRHAGVEGPGTRPICRPNSRRRAGLRARNALGRRTGPARSPDCRLEPFGAGPQVHGPPGPDHDRRIGAPHGRRSAGVQELRRHEPQRSPRKADAADLKLRGD